MTRLRPATIAAIGITLVALLGGCDWPMHFGNSSGTNANPAAGIDVRNVATLGIPWTAATPSSSVVEGGGVVLAGSSALNAANGTVRWTSSSLGLAAIDGNTVYSISATTDTGYTMNALSLQSGAVLWSTPHVGGAAIGAPVVSRGRIYVRSELGHDGGDLVDVWDAASHQFVRNYSFFPSTVGGPAFWNGTGYMTGISTVNGQTQDVLTAFDEATGAIRWTVPATRCFANSLIATNGRVYADGTTFDAATGAALWNWPVCPVGNALSSALAATTFVAVTGSFTGPVSLTAFDATNGTLRWAQPIARAQSAFQFAPVIANDVVLASNGSTLMGFDLSTGAKVWTPTPIQGVGNPIVADGALYASTTTTLFAYRPTS